eukprot:m.196771 g.196771  ORF g.196771 m.196771 type:complete len:822 (-) comp32634_c0_seq1:41-2506(-)
MADHEYMFSDRDRYGEEAVSKRQVVGNSKTFPHHTNIPLNTDGTPVSFLVEHSNGVLIGAILTNRIQDYKVQRMWKDPKCVCFYLKDGSLYAFGELVGTLTGEVESNVSVSLSIQRRNGKNRLVLQWGSRRGVEWVHPEVIPHDTMAWPAMATTDKVCNVSIVSQPRNSTSQQDKPHHGSSKPRSSSRAVASQQHDIAQEPTHRVSRSSYKQPTNTISPSNSKHRRSMQPQMQTKSHPQPQLQTQTQTEASGNLRHGSLRFVTKVVREVASEHVLNMHSFWWIFFLETIPTALAVVMSALVTGNLNDSRSRSFWPYNPIGDLGGSGGVWILIIAWLYGHIQPYDLFDVLVVVILTSQRAIIIAYKYAAALGDTDFESLNLRSYSENNQHTKILLANYTNNVAGTQLQAFLDQLFSGMHQHELDPSLLEVQIEPDAARIVWSKVKDFRDIIYDKANDVEEKKKQRKLRKKKTNESDNSNNSSKNNHTNISGPGYINHKFQSEAGDICEAYIGHTDGDVDDMVAHGTLPVSVLIMYIVFSSYHVAQPKGMTFLRRLMMFTLFVSTLPLMLRHFAEGVPISPDPLALFIRFVLFLTMAFHCLTSFIYAMLPWVEVSGRRKVAGYISDLINVNGINVSDDVAPIKLDLSNARNVVAWDTIRQLCYGPNLAETLYSRCQFYLCVTFAAECLIGFLMSTFMDSKALTFINVHNLSVSLPCFLRTFTATIGMSFNVLASSSINGEADEFAMSLLRNKMKLLQQPKRCDVASAIELLDTAHKSVLAAKEGSPMTVMYLEANWGTIGLVFSVLAMVFFKHYEILVEALSF